jgi:hypothetical protein
VTTTGTLNLTFRGWIGILIAELPDMRLAEWRSRHDLDSMNRCMLATRNNSVTHRFLRRIIHANDIRKSFFCSERDRRFCGRQEAFSSGAKVLGTIVIEVDAHFGRALEIEICRGRRRPLFTQKTHGSRTRFMNAVFYALLSKNQRQIKPKFLRSFAGYRFRKHRCIAIVPRGRRVFSRIALLELSISSFQAVRWTRASTYPASIEFVGLQDTGRLLKARESRIKENIYLPVLSSRSEYSS